jgi:hypothetical protein
MLELFQFFRNFKIAFYFLKKNSPRPGFTKSRSSVFFSDKGNTLILRDINYIQPLQQCNILAVRMHIAKKTKKRIQVINYITPFLLSVEYLMHG